MLVPDASSVLEGEAPPATETAEFDTPAESPVTAGETTGDESTTETEPVAAESAEAPTEDM